MNSPLLSQKRRIDELTPVSQQRTVNQGILEGNIRDAKIFFRQVLMSIDSLVDSYKDTVENERIAELLDTELLSKLQQIRADLGETEAQKRIKDSRALGDWQSENIIGRGKTQKRKLGKKRRS